MKKFPPIPSRDLGGVFTINDLDDGSPIKELFTLGDGLLLITFTNKSRQTCAKCQTVAD